MSRKILPLALAAALLPGLAAADDVTIYRVKNADGTYSYTQVPTQGAEVRNLDSRDPDLPPPAETPKTPEQQTCDQARANLQMLDSEEPVGVDKDGDGIAEAPMSAEERAAQRALAKSQVDVYCQPASGG
ncbi:DUF4124 domain-containing protein [Arenimonas composti]|uniref:DUF4124 domain-containing protein n=1 Tax=Arenimonas composti TR7-09 = DSM 18010 TaxID=1121013 RepID=A0A091BC01_9GAMM|nr:DUF4124 domain-containing protein [Arenimonas composti]KFN50198.1 hypothetical protein P873_07525 [Arenimonas composti TR7-09 = DSM 18010]